MVRELDAVFEACVLRPLEPLALREQQLVRVTVDDRQASEQQEAAPRKNDLWDDRRIDRTEEMLWLANEAKAYAGQSVALIGPRLLAHGPDASEVREAARAFGHEVSVEVFGIVTYSPVYFFGDPSISKNVLGRIGWLDRVRLGVVDHDCMLYLAGYDRELG